MRSTSLNTGGTALQRMSNVGSFEILNPCSLHWHHDGTNLRKEDGPTMHNIFSFSDRDARTATPRLQVILGGHTFKAFVAAPREFEVLGIVRMGMEYGLLARNSTGRYVRVNGSSVQELNRHEVEDAMNRIRITGRGESYATSRSHQPPVPQPRCIPTVTIRKSRRVLHGMSVPADFRAHSALTR